MNRFFFRYIRALDPALLAALFLTACGVNEQAGRDIADGQKLSAEQLAAQRAAQRGEVLRVDRPYYGSAVEVKRGSRQGKPLPKELEGARGISLKLAGQSDIRTIAQSITSVSGIPVNIRTRYLIGTGETAELIEVPIGTRMRVDYSGTLSKFLDQVAARMDVAWTYNGTVITIDRMVTRDYRVPLPATNSTFTSELGGATGTQESSTTISLSTTSTTQEESDPWAELAARLKPLTPPPARLTVLRSSGRVSVFGPPSVQRGVRDVIDDIEAIYGQRVGLEIGVYFLDSAEAENFGLTTSGFQIGQNIARSGSAIIVGGPDGGGIRLTGENGSINLEALARDRSVVDFRLASTIAQSGVVAPISMTRSETYIERLTVERDEDGTSVEIEPGEVEYGISIHALPRIIDDTRIQLFLTVLQSDLVGGVIKELPAGENAIGAPELDQRTIQNQSILSPGETLVLSGYEQNMSLGSRSGVGPLKFLGIGGRTTAQTSKVRMVVLVRPSLIPQGRGRS